MDHAIKGAFTFLFIFVSLNLNGQVNLSAGFEKDLHAYLTAIAHKKGFSGEVLVAKGDNILFQEAYGLLLHLSIVEDGMGRKFYFKKR